MIVQPLLPSIIDLTFIIKMTYKHPTKPKIENKAIDTHSINSE